MGGMSKPLSFANASEESAYYGVKPAALRRWKAVGIKSGDPFPGEDPSAVVEWYKRHFNKGVPQTLALAAARFAEKPKKRGTLKSLEKALEGLDQGGLAVALDRARRIEALYGSKLEEALKSGNKPNEEFYRGPHIKALQALRDTEKSVTDLARKRKELIERSAVAASWTNLHSHLPRTIEREMIAARPAAVTADDWTKAVRSAMDQAFSRLPEVLPEILAGASTEEPTPPEAETEAE